jgi:hypothetical protein
MKRSLVWVITMMLGFGVVAGRAAAEASAIATSMGDLRWGLSEHDVALYAKREFGTSIDKTLVNFEHKGSRWDSSPVAGEFTYGNGESMMVGKAKDGTENYFFFHDGKLWKLVKLVDKKGDFKKFSQTVESKFGKGRAKKGELTPGQGNTQWLEFMDRNSRMRAADSSGKRSTYAMIFEEMATVRELASTRPKAPSRLGGLSDDDSAAPKNELKASGGDSGSKGNANSDQIAKASTKRSVFGNERHEENETEYQTRKQKVAAEARERQQRLHERKEDAKKGEVLKQLDGLNDSDPLGGL